MSIDLMDEHERGERIRRWLHDNGTALLGGVAIGLLAFFGWQWHKNGQMQARYDAAMQYETLRKAAQEKQDDTAVEVASGLQDKFAGTAYVTLAHLQIAQLRTESGDLEAAATSLEAARSSAQDPVLIELAALRLARLRHSQGQHELALELAAAASVSYAGLAAEIRGDVLRDQGKREEAVSAYQDALTHLAQGVPTRGLIELKLADLGATTAPLES
jgi:predicted negative regulator of RcsB-dependent stress response